MIAIRCTIVLCTLLTAAAGAPRKGVPASIYIYDLKRPSPREWLAILESPYVQYLLVAQGVGKQPDIVVARDANVLAIYGQILKSYDAVTTYEANHVDWGRYDMVIMTDVWSDPTVAWDGEAPAQRGTEPMYDGRMVGNHVRETPTAIAVTGDGR